MALKIRLSRGGAKARPYYHIVIAENRAKRDGRFIERVGYYNPLLSSNDPQRVVLNTERIIYWYNIGARPTNRVARFINQANIIDIKYQVFPQTKKNKPKAKALERLKDKS